MTPRLHFSDELFDAQLMRALAYAPQRGADLGECLATASHITEVDGELWHDQWRATAEHVESLALASAASGHLVSAREAWLRASNYHRTSGLFVFGPGERFRDSLRRQTAAFRNAIALFEQPVLPLDIPYEDTTLPGYLFRAAGDHDSRPLLIVTDGYDGTCEELYFAAAAPALERGYDVLVFDGPGQGSVIAEQGLPFRPDWEHVVTPVVDHALTLDSIDPKRIALLGWSFGGYLAPRAATAEHRIAACISDCGPYDLFEVSMDRVPGTLAKAFRRGVRWARPVLRRAMLALAKRTTAGWGLRRNLYVHGVQDPVELLDLATEYSLHGRVERIACPTFVCTTEGDDLSVRAPDLARDLTCPTEMVTFRSDDGVFGHCEMAGRAQFHSRAFDWLDATLGR